MVSNNTYTSTINCFNGIIVQFQIYKILEFIKIIETDNKPAEYVKELNRNKFIISGTDDKLFIYDKFNYEKKKRD